MHYPTLISTVLALSAASVSAQVTTAPTTEPTPETAPITIEVPQTNTTTDTTPNISTGTGLLAPGHPLSSYPNLWSIILAVPTCAQDCFVKAVDIPEIFTCGFEGNATEKPTAEQIQCACNNYEQDEVQESVKTCVAGLKEEQCTAAQAEEADAIVKDVFGGWCRAYLDAQDVEVKDPVSDDDEDVEVVIGDNSTIPTNGTTTKPPTNQTTTVISTPEPTQPAENNGNNNNNNNNNDDKGDDSAATAFTVSSMLMGLGMFASVAFAL